MPKDRGVAGTTDDPVVGYEPLELEDVAPSDRKDGKWLLFIDFNAIARAEKATGWNLLQGLSAFLINIAGVADYIGLLYAGLLRAHPKITVEQVGMMVRIDLIQDIRLALIKAFNRGMPEKKRLQYEVVAPPAEDPPSSGDKPQTGNSGSSAGPSPESTSDSPTASSMS